MKATPAIARELLKHPLGWIACGFGSGLSPMAPGTVASVLALLPGWYLLHAVWWLQIVVIASTFAIGVLAADHVIKRFGVQDPSVVVTDEFVGQWLALCVPVWLQSLQPGWPILNADALAGPAHLGIALIAFRVFDVIKPWPVSWADRELKGGFGAMADDALAGMLAGIATAITMALI